VGENLFRSGLASSQLPNAATQAWFDEVKLCYIGDDCPLTHFKIQYKNQCVHGEKQAIFRIRNKIFLTSALLQPLLAFEAQRKYNLLRRCFQVTYRRQVALFFARIELSTYA